MLITEIMNYWLAGNIGVNAHTYTGNVFDVLNPKANAEYCAVVLDFVSAFRDRHVTTITLRVYALDRLTEGTTNYFNALDVCARYLAQGLAYLGERYEIGETYTINPVEQDFTDKLAGVWADVTVNIPNGLCSTEPTNISNT